MRSCQPLISAQPEPSNTAADSLTALSTAFTYGSIVLAILALIAGFAWRKTIVADAGAAAKAEAKKCADEYIREWLAKEAPGIVRERVDIISDATLGPGNDAEAADEIGKEA